MVSQRWAPRRCNGFRASEFPNQSDHCAQRSTPCTIHSVSLSFQCIAHPSKAIQIVLFVDRCDRHQHSRTWISRQWFFRAYASSCFSVRAPRLLAVPSNQTWRTLGVTESLQNQTIYQFRHATGTALAGIAHTSEKLCISLGIVGSVAPIIVFP